MGDDARRLARVGLANYFAGALLLPYRDFLTAAEADAYDIEKLGRRFGVGFETVCHRLSTLQRADARGVPFFFVRVDRAATFPSGSRPLISTSPALAVVVRCGMFMRRSPSPPRPDADCTDARWPDLSVDRAHCRAR